MFANSSLWAEDALRECGSSSSRRVKAEECRPVKQRAVQNAVVPEAETSAGQLATQVP